MLVAPQWSGGSLGLLLRTWLLQLRPFVAARLGIVCQHGSQRGNGLLARVRELVPRLHRCRGWLGIRLGDGIECRRNRNLLLKRPVDKCQKLKGGSGAPRLVGRVAGSYVVRLVDGCGPLD